MCAYTYTHTHLGIMCHTQVLTNSFHCVWSRAWIRVQVSPLHTDTKDGLKGYETHHHTVPSKSSRSYTFSHFSHSTHSPHTPYFPHPLHSTPTRAPTHICGVLTSLPRPVEGEEQPLTPEHGRWMQHFCSLIQKQHTLRDRLTRDVDCQYCLLLELRVLLDHKLPLLQSSVHKHQHVGPNQC